MASTATTPFSTSEAIGGFHISVGPSPLEEVTGQEADVGADQLGADLPGGRLLGRRHDGGSGHRHRGVDGQREAGGDEGGGEEELHPRRIAQPGFPQEPGRIKPSAP